METPEVGPRAKLAPILARYPAYQKEIEEHFILNQDFAEVCEDYLEVRLLIESWESQDELPNSVVAEYRELLARLEAEIQERLETYHSSGHSASSDWPIENH
ncbi:MAG: hypothetical protein JSW55_02615 [Chloroflexota bacterium]|nr:MAG: hypothetical protein JSW55_02615 [Chloroflexota bacterium]